MSVWPTLRVINARRKKWAWIAILKPAEPHTPWDVCWVLQSLKYGSRCWLILNEIRLYAATCRPGELHKREVSQRAVQPSLAGHDTPVAINIVLFARKNNNDDMQLPCTAKAAALLRPLSWQTNQLYIEHGFPTTRYAERRRRQIFWTTDFMPTLNL